MCLDAIYPDPRFHHSYSVVLGITASVTKHEEEIKGTEIASVLSHKVPVCTGNSQNTPGVMTSPGL